MFISYYVWFISCYVVYLEKYSKSVSLCSLSMVSLSIRKINVYGEVLLAVVLSSYQQRRIVFLLLVYCSRVITFVKSTPFMVSTMAVISVKCIFL